jgi:hypothetical protein
MTNIVHQEWITIVPAMKIPHGVQIAAEERIRESLASPFLGGATKRIFEAQKKERLFGEMNPINASLLFCGDSDRLE